MALAAHLGLPRVAVVKALDYDAGSGSATVERELEGGLIELLRVRLPALLTIQTGINEPRYANLRAIKQAKEKPLELLEPGDLGLDAAAVERPRARACARSPRRTRAAAPRCSTARRPRWPQRIAEIVKERMTG